MQTQLFVTNCPKPHHQQHYKLLYWHFGASIFFREISRKITEKCGIFSLDLLWKIDHCILWNGHITKTKHPITLYVI